MENEFLDRAQLDQKEAAQKAKEKKKSTKRASKRSAKATKRSGSNAFVQILNGEFLTREFITNNLSFIFFIIFLLLLVVAKGYYGKELTCDVNTTQMDLDEVTSDYFESKARLEEETRRVRLVEELEADGLKETVNPTKVIKIKGAKNETATKVEDRDNE